MKTTVIYLLFSILLHPVHVSLTGIEYDAKDKIFNIFVKVYSDDMAGDMKIGNAIDNKEFSNERESFHDWLSKRLSIRVDGRPLDLELLSVENDGVEHKFLLVAKNKIKPHEVTVSSTINTRLYHDQTNMVMFKCNEVEEGFKLTASDTLKVFVIN